MFGTVFLGVHVRTARKVAIKVFDWETLTKAGKRPERKAEKQLRREIGTSCASPRQHCVRLNR